MTPGSLTPSLKPKCSFPLRLPDRVAASCWNTITILAAAHASRCCLTVAWRSWTVSEATVSTAWTTWPLPLPKSHISGELSPVSPSARLSEPCLKASRPLPGLTEGSGSFPVSSRRPAQVKLTLIQVAFSAFGSSPAEAFLALLKAALKVATCLVVEICGSSALTQVRARAASSNLRNSRVIWSFLKPAITSPWMSSLSRSLRSFTMLSPEDRHLHADAAQSNQQRMRHSHALPPSDWPITPTAARSRPERTGRGRAEAFGLVGVTRVHASR